MKYVSGMCVVVVGVFFFLPSFVRAEGPSMVLETGTTLTMVPTYPAAGESVRVTIKTVKTDVHSAKVQWSVNGKVVAEGRNLDSYEFTMGDVGSTVHITATIIPDVGTPLTKTLSYTVADVSLVWEANTYTPPFYKGRSLQSMGATVNILAIPRVYDTNGKPYPASSLSYEWYTKESSNPLYSGYGLDSVTLKNPDTLAPFWVMVKVKDRTGEVRALRTLEIPLTPSYILFYPDSPLLGVRYEDPFMGEYNLTNESLTVVAEPYFAVVDRRTDSSLSYLWTIGTQSLTTPGSIVLRPEGSGSGAARVRLSITGSGRDAWAQQVKGETTIRFVSGGNNPSETRPL